MHSYSLGLHQSLAFNALGNGVVAISDFCLILTICGCDCAVEHPAKIKLIQLSHTAITIRFITLSPLINCVVDRF